MTVNWLLCLFAVYYQNARCLLSLVSLSYAPVAYVTSLKSTWDEEVTYWKVSLMFFFYGIVVSTRVVAFTTLAAYSTYAVFGFAVIHLMFMLPCVWRMENDPWFASRWGPWKKRLFKLCMAILFEFIYMDFSRNNTNKKTNLFSTFFYIIVCIEDAIIITLWFAVRDIQDANPEYGYIIYYAAVMFLVDLLAWYWYCWKCQCWPRNN